MSAGAWGGCGEKSGCRIADELACSGFRRWRAAIRDVRTCGSIRWLREKGGGMSGCGDRGFAES